MTIKRVHQSTIWQEMEATDKKGNYILFSFTYAKKDGTLSRYKDAVLSSIHSKGSTVNIMLASESKPKTFRRICFTEFNGKKLYI